MVIKELLEIGRDRLKNLEYMDPLKESVYILSEILKKDKSYIYINLHKWVDREEEQRFLELIDRRSKGEPISYIFSTKEFMGIDFFVEKGVLIPRPETEALVEYVLSYISNTFKGENIKVLDIGTGTGAIALSIGKYSKNIEVLGIDISDIPIRVANENLSRLKLKNVAFRKSNLFENIKEDEKFSIIISNPPYIKTSLIENLQVDVREFEPKLALDGGEDGLSFYRKITKESKNFLLNNGMIIYEIGFDQGKSVEKILLDEDFIDIEIIKDFQGLDRIVLAFKK